MASLRHVAAGLLAGAVSIAAVSLHYARDASGCGGGSAGQVTEVEPAADVTWPANGAVMIEGENLVVPGQLVATVDGTPATLTVVESLSVANRYWLAVDPEPAEGSVVAIQGNPCNDQLEQGLCAVDINYTAGPPDETPPPAPLGVTFDLKVLTGLESPDCPGLDAGSYFYVHISDPADPDEAARDVFELEVFTDDTLTTLVGRDVFSAANTPPTQGIMVLGSGGPDACLRVTARDIAGNVGGTASTCKACFYRVAAHDNEGPGTTPYPGGPCDPGGSTSASTTTGGAATTSAGAGGSAPYGFPPDNGAASDGDSGCAYRAPSRGGFYGLMATIALGLSLLSRRGRPGRP